MKTFFSLILVANLVFLSIQAGFFGHLLPDGREPARVQEQISPDKLHILPSDSDAKTAPVAVVATPAPGAVTPAAVTPKPIACVELGSFSGDDAKRAEVQFTTMGLGGRYSQRRTDEPAGYIVYLPPFKTKGDADRASAELRRIGVDDFFVIQDNGPFKLAISLGVFRTEEAAKAHLTSLSQLGVRNAKTGERSTTVQKIWFQFRNIDQDADNKLAELKTPFPASDLHDCPASATTAGSSSGT